MNKNQRTTTSIKVINDFSLDFTNSDFFKKKLSPSQRVRNLERQRIFIAKKHENKSTGVISVQTEIKVREVSVQTFDVEKEYNTENNTSNSEAYTEATSSKPLICNRTISLHPNFNCHLCGQLFPSKTDLLKHHNSKHQGHPRKFACEYCDENLMHEFMLNSDKQNEHDIFVCARCNNQFFLERRDE